MLAVKEVASLLDKKLGTKRTAMIMEGTGVNRAHVKLCPLYGLQKEFEEDWTKEGGLFGKIRRIRYQPTKSQD